MMFFLTFLKKKMLIFLTFLSKYQNPINKRYKIWRTRQFSGQCMLHADVVHLN